MVHDKSQAYVAESERHALIMSDMHCDADKVSVRAQYAELM
jgi:hypothetical protein